MNQSTEPVCDRRYGPLGPLLRRRAPDLVEAGLRCAARRSCKRMKARHPRNRPGADALVLDASAWRYDQSPVLLVVEPARTAVSATLPVSACDV